MNKYLYALMGIAAISGTVLLVGAKTSSAQTVPNQSSVADVQSVNKDFTQDMVEWQVQLNGWKDAASQGELSNPVYLAALSDNLNSISSNIALYQQLYADTGSGK